MTFRSLLIVLLFNILIISIGKTQPNVSGFIQHLPNFPSKFVDARNVDVWLPYDYNPQKKYAVIYMHDGQMLFNAKTTWNQQEWGVDETLTQLLADKKIKDCIVVGIWNNGAKRATEYFPQRAFEQISKENQGKLLAAVRPQSQQNMYALAPVSDAYLKFLVTELKPYIDSTYATYTDSRNTIIIGSSMGGLISMYAFMEYPEVFGAAACLSTHWIGVFDNSYPFIPESFNKYLNGKITSGLTGKIYFDYGTVGLDSYYKPHQIKVDEIFKSKAFPMKNYKSVEIVGADHSENDWQSRLPEILEFIVGRE